MNINVVILLYLGLVRTCQNRSQIVTVNGIRSEKETLSCGIPQGSILSPLLFLLFINDLPLYLKEVVSADTTLLQRNL